MMRVKKQFFRGISVFFPFQKLMMHKNKN